MISSLITLIQNFCDLVVPQTNNKKSFFALHPKLIMINPVTKQLCFDDTSQWIFSKTDLDQGMPMKTMNYYFAPEFFTSQLNHGWEKSLTFSLGLIMFYMLTGKHLLKVILDEKRWNIRLNGASGNNP